MAALFGLIRDGLPERLLKTAHALARDVASADGRLKGVELHMLEEIREELQTTDCPPRRSNGVRVRHLRSWQAAEEGDWQSPQWENVLK